MSTYWGYACVSHDPPLISDHWFNHGGDLLVEVFHRVRAGQWPLDPRLPELLEEPAPVDHRGYLTAAPIHWLRSHPNCEVVLDNEYGHTKPIAP